MLSRQQLEHYGVYGSAITRWLRDGRLHRIHPHVYAVGHTAISLDGRLIAALRYGGDEAVLSHTTAAWVWSLIEAEPTRIHLTVPCGRRSLPGVRAHRSREVDRTTCRDLPVTSVARTLLDLASVVTRRQLKRAVAEADYRGLLEPSEVRVRLGKGRPGSRALREALAGHLPQLARTLSVLEERFFELCESAGLPRPEINSRVGRMRVDAVWRNRWVAVELDGGQAHAGVAAMKRDRQRELALRATGFQVVRYSWEQITNQREQVLADLRSLLDP